MTIGAKIGPRIGLCNEVIADRPFATQCDLAAKLGYDGLEVSPFTLGEEPHRLTANERTALRRAASDAGIVVTGLHYLMRAPAGLSITSRDKAQRERTVGVIRDLCRLAADLGAKVLVHGSPDQRKLEPGFEAEGRQHAIECFAAAGEAAAENGVVYCIEPLSRRQTDHINTVEEAADIVTAIGNKALCTMIDCSSAAPTEPLSVPDTIRRWLPTGLIAHVHLNDPNRRGPGEGELEFAPIFGALREQNYAGDYGVEPFVYIPDGSTCAARAIGYVRGVMEGLP